MTPDGLPPALSGFTKSSFTAEGKTRDVYETGSGPAVIVISEIPGITPKVAGFARQVASIGCTAVLPHLFGEPGAEPTAGRAARVLAQACISKEFSTWARHRTSPVTSWLRLLAAAKHSQCGGPGVGAVGMCLTGGFALAMMVDDIVLAPVLSQPSLPFPMTAAQRNDLGISAADLQRVRQRCEEEDVCVLGLRFTGDRAAPAQRFERLRRELGDKFVAVEIDSSKGNAGGYRPAAHSVLTEDLKTEPGSATRDALDKVLDLFRTKLVETA
ncbi:MAG TPA: dienelactone hydrolase family protein [Acidimicrobiales bacterium]|jgi:dienelactone hydrolase|nr:dienelactone hydrolase family protein [Acidimicrobiales bacterium]